MLLPVLILLMAMLVQPACLLYTRCVMQSAAAEGCRLAATLSPGGNASAAAEAYVLRRLSAVPDVSVFHAGGQQGWEIEVSGSSEEAKASVRITTTARPLPFLGAVSALLGQGDGSGGVVLEVEVSRATRPGWLEGGYDDWTSMWA